MESHEPEESEKLVALRRLAAEGFEAIDRAEAVTVDGREQLRAFIAGAGNLAARRVERRARAK
jgi:hypothetical protein